jgi:hypothetical protein
MMYITMQWRQTHFVVLSYDLYFVRHIKRIGIYHVIVENNKVNCKEYVHLFTLLLQAPPGDNKVKSNTVQDSSVCI